ncbi:hypothetical protein HK101_004843 [Irineochytrium annulatum]|nr:hypothetical protein HK101_004843 [Irineochytrium annulatum]
MMLSEAQLQDAQTSSAVWERLCGGGVGGMTRADVVAVRRACLDAVGFGGWVKLEEYSAFLGRLKEALVGATSFAAGLGFVDKDGVWIV